jgi:uncharacterized membrane protein YjjP (DUF1212 family)
MFRRFVEPLRGGDTSRAFNVIDSSVLSNSTLAQGDDETKPILEVLFPESDTKRHYNWREFFPMPRSAMGPLTADGAKVRKKTARPRLLEGQIKVIRWFVTGSSQSKPSESKNLRNLRSLARLLILLREYEQRYGATMLVENIGGISVQKQVLTNITKDLYSSGTPTWVLETVMSRVAEGMTGRQGVEILLLPRRCFIYFPEAEDSGTSQRARASTALFKISPGFDIAKLGAVEQVAVRLASFASNTKSVERLNAEWLKMPSQLQLNTAKIEARRTHESDVEKVMLEDPDSLAKEILDLASSTYGLFFYANSPQFQAAAKQADNAAPDREDDFWQVDDTMRDTFARLAANEASNSLERLRQQEKQIFSPGVVSMFRILSSAGACAMWFQGGVSDMLVSAVLAVTVAKIGSFFSDLQLAFEERMLVEVLSSFVVGLIAGLLSIRWPGTFCFGAIAVASVMDMLQGFKVVYAMIEIMSKNIVTGTTRWMEGIMFTGLISYSLKFGLDMAFRLVGKGVPHANYSSMLECGAGISPAYFPLILPLAAAAWSGLFRPSAADLPLMTFHGMLAFCLSWAGAPLFVAAMVVTFSAGIVSRFTGKEALGNTLSGLYALVPGTYMVRALLSPSRANFIESVLFAASAIGLGGWTGSLLCSPTILGKSSWSFRKRGEKKQATMLYF